MIKFLLSLALVGTAFLFGGCREVVVTDHHRGAVVHGRVYDSHPRYYNRGYARGPRYYNRGPVYTSRSYAPGYRGNYAPGYRSRSRVIVY